MITTSTGAKKLESSDNWREIFPNPGTSAAGAHNASVDAHDRIQAEVAPIINGKRCSLGAASGDYVLLRNSTITGKTDGAYVAAKAIPANTDLDSTYLGSAITGGIVNELNNKITSLSIYDQTTASAPSTVTTGRIQISKFGKFVAIGINYETIAQDTNPVGTIPTGFRPKQTVFPVTCMIYWGSEWRVWGFNSIWINTDGGINQNITGAIIAGAKVCATFIYEYA